MSKDDCGKVMRVSELGGVHSTDKQTKLAEQWKEGDWMVKLKAS